MKKYFFLAALFIFIFSTNSSAKKDINNIFPLTNYPQHLNFWFNEYNNNYKTIRLSKEIQNLYFKILKNNYYGNNSPWNKNYIQYLINPEPITQKTIFQGLLIISNNYKNIINSFNETNYTLYGLNFRKIESSWINKIIENMDITQFKIMIYSTKNRVITIDRTMITSLPTDDPAYQTYKKAGSGYPFNLINLSIIPAGTPAYILGTTKDKGWHFIVAPGVMGWIKANNIAYVNKHFINKWIIYSNKELATILTPGLPIIDTKNNHQFTALAGTLLPVYKKYLNKLTLMIPVKSSNNTALIKYTNLLQPHATIIPLELTMENFAKVIRPLIGRSYGWGGINYYNDCSLELMTIYKAFGIFLTRNSLSQATYSGLAIDISKLTLEDRKEIIVKNGIPFGTLLYIKGHIMIYIGTYKTNYSKNTILTYQNIWGLAPKNKTYRDIIGKAIILPLLDKYPENYKNESLINKETFILINLINPINYKIGLSNLLY